MTKVVNVYREFCDELCTRPSLYSNPFVIGRDGDRAAVLLKYTGYLDEHPEIVAQARIHLRGKRIGCVCKPKECHLDILVKKMGER